MNRSIPKAVIFDWDGTLADTTVPIIETMCSVFAQNRLPIPGAQAIRDLIGCSLPLMVQQLAAAYPPAVQARLINGYTQHARNPNKYPMQMFAAARPCLDSLHAAGFWLAIATGKSRYGLNQAIMQTETAHYWYATRCADECASKPAPDMVWAICGELGLQPQQVWVVGDTDYDIHMAAAAGAQAVAVTTGAHSAARLQQARPWALIDSLSRLPALLGLSAA